MANKVRVYGKAQNRTALGIMHAYLAINPNATLDDFKEAFPVSLNPDSGVKFNFVDVKNIKEASGEKWNGFFAEPECLLNLADGTQVAVVSMWTKPSLERLVTKAADYGIEIASLNPDDKDSVKKVGYKLEYLDGFVPSVAAKEGSTKGKSVEEDFNIEIDASNKVSCYICGKLCENTKEGLRRVAAFVGFDYDPDWTTQQLGNKLTAFINSKGASAPTEAASPTDDADNEEGFITVHVEKEGELEKALSGYNPEDICKLKITGIIGEDDYYDIRESNITDVILPDGLTEICDDAFYNDENLQSVKIPDSVTKIGHASFQRCENITSINLPDGLSEIGGNAFSTCEALTSLTIPDSVTSLGSHAFYNCIGLRSVNIPAGITVIECSTFDTCRKLADITIHDGITEIEDYAFYECHSLTAVYCRPTTPPRLGEDVFMDVHKKMKIYVPRASVEAYKTADGWSEYSKIIEGYDF